MPFKIKMYWILWIFLGLILVGSWGEFSFAKIYKYRDPSGNWHYTDTPTDEQRAEEGEGNKSEFHPISWDLNRYLEEKLRPRNSLEKARNFTVTIQTPIGLGSGFFIDENGSIITNRHVFEGDKNQIAAASQVFKVETARLEQFRKELFLFAVNLVQYEGLGEDPQMAHSLKNQDLDSFIRLYKEINRKDTAHKINSERFDKLMEDYHQKQEKLDKLKEYLQNAEIQADNPPGYVTVILADNTPFEAKFVTKSPDHDLALFQLSGYKTPMPKFGDVLSLPAGSRVYAIGSPLGLSHSVSEGIFSALRRDEHGAWIIQSTAKVNKGKCGGPLVDEQGRVLGVNTAKMMRPGVEGISFSISIHTIMEAFKRDLK